MAAVEFGDAELFAQFEEKAPIRARIIDEGVEDEGERSDRLRKTLDVCEETIERLNAENEELKRKLNILNRPTGIKITDSKTDGPLCQVNYGNSIISKQCRKEIEDFIYCLAQKRLHECNNDPEGSALHVNPHHASFVMEESYKAKTSNDSKHIKNAFSILGSVLYFTHFCVDKLGQPLLNENPQLTDGWEVPKYQQIFGQIIALEGQEVQVKEKRPRPCCFNCCSEAHQLRDCPEPKDMARINEKRKEFSHNNQGNQRYHAEEVEERFAKYKPGIMSQDLLDALGITANTLPPFIYRMRELGYPPGWLKEAEMENSGLMLYDGSNDEDENNSGQKISYDVAKLVDFPGFNVSTPPNTRDDYRSFGSIPMQPQQWKHNFAAFLSSNFPTTTSCSKRRHESELTPQKTKKWRSNSEQSRQASDMEMESDHDAPQMRSDGFHFHPPLPPGCSSLSVPPPLPLGTPPTTPPVPKGTPPATPPTNASPSTQVRGMTEGEESEDGLTLEELEEQQRLLWAALEKADTTTNSDSEAGASETPVPSSPSVVTSLKLDTEEDCEKMEDSSHAFEIKSTPSSPVDPGTNCEDETIDKTSCDELEKHSVNENLIDLPEEMSDIIVLDEIYEENSNLDATNGTPASPQMSTTESNAPVADDTEEPLISKVAFVPHRSRFAAGIIPFEDTPEFTEVAEATGVYLKIRDLLKGSPRNQAKNKK